MTCMVLIQKTDDFARVKDIRIKIFNKELGLANSDIFDNDDAILELESRQVTTLLRSGPLK